MTCVIQAVGFANGMPCDKAGQYLESFDPDTYGGRGYVTWTPQALQSHALCQRGRSLRHAEAPIRRPAAAARRQTQSPPHRLHRRVRTHYRSIRS